jgi:hypothetical protein
MQHLILKTDIEKSKLDTLLFLLKSWNIEAEYKSDKSKVSKTKQNADFSLSAGLWKDYPMDAQTLRKQAWDRSK